MLGLLKDSLSIIYPPTHGLMGYLQLFTGDLKTHSVRLPRMGLVRCLVAECSGYPQPCRVALLCTVRMATLAQEFDAQPNLARSLFFVYFCIHACRRESCRRCAAGNLVTKYLS